MSRHDPRSTTKDIVDIGALFGSSALGGMSDLIDFSALDIGEIFSQILAFVQGYFFSPEDGYELPPPPSNLAKLEQKAAHVVDPRLSADVYTKAVNDNAQSISTLTPDGKKITFELVKSFNDPVTGLGGRFLLDRKTGTGLVVYEGMDQNGSPQDVQNIAAAMAGKRGGHFGSGDRFYREMASRPDVKQIGFITYSMTGMVGADLAARYGAKGTTIAPSGSPDMKNAKGQSLYTAEHLQNIKNNVIALVNPNDPFVGFAGRIYGSIVKLGGSSAQAGRSAFNSNAGAPHPHLPQAYHNALINMGPLIQGSVKNLLAFNAGG